MVSHPESSPVYVIFTGFHRPSSTPGTCVDRAYLAAMDPDSYGIGVGSVVLGRSQASEGANLSFFRHPMSPGSVSRDSGLETFGTDSTPLPPKEARHLITLLINSEDTDKERFGCMCVCLYTCMSTPWGLSVCVRVICLCNAALFRPQPTRQRAKSNIGSGQRVNVLLYVRIP